ncbi:MAG TPA: hypothetical protein VMR34_03900 [Candidatus Saccharimonadales bacterium]|nr:hypothetical protein [Candidatus Saccharimonadales bacterium]
MSDNSLLTDEQLKVIRAKLDKLCDESDTTVFADIYKFQKEHLEYMGQHYSGCMNQFEMYFSATVNAGLNINYLDKKAWPDHRALQFTIATHSLKQFFSAYNLLNDGAYEDAIALLRSVYEAFLRIIFASCNPKKAYNAYTMAGQTGVKFNATNLVDNELKLDWNNYKIMSAFTHSNLFNVLETMTNIAQKGQKEPITLTYEVNKDMISIVMNYISFLMWVFLRLFSEVFVVDYSQHKSKEAIKEHVDLLSEYAGVASFAVKNHTVSKYWRQVGGDIDKIFELMHYMDANPAADWKKQWKEIQVK